jgi:hypothetical protein
MSADTKLRDGLATECPVTVEHALVHLRSARDSLKAHDHDQVDHDLGVASLILEILEEEACA